MTASEFAVQRDWQPDRRGPARWILSHALRHKTLILGVLIGALGNAALAGVLPVLVGRGFDAVTASPPDMRGLATAASLVALSQLVRGAVLQLGRNLCSEAIGQRMERAVRDELYVSLIGKSMSFHDTQSTGDLMARATNDVREINMMFNPGFNMVIGSANFLFVPIFVAPTIHLQLILAPVIYLLVYFFAVRGYLRQLRPTAEGVRREFGRMNTRLAEAIDGIETVKGAAQETHEIKRFVAAVTGWRDAYLAQADVEARFVPLLLLGLLQAAGLLHSLLLFRAGLISVGQVISFNGLLMLFGFPTFAAQFAYSRVSSGLASARRILELITATTELDQNVEGYDASMQGAVTFENVTFCYKTKFEAIGQQCNLNDEGVTLEQINFHVAPGQTVALVGQTGSGKSTIAKLINRTYDVDEGRILAHRVFAPPDLDHRAGYLSLLAHRRREHRLWPSGGDPRGDRGGSASRPGSRFHHGFQGWLRYDHRRARGDAFRRPTPAAGAGAGLPDQSVHPDPGRRHQRHRQRDRGPYPTGYRTRCLGSHDLPRHAPAVPDPVDRPDHRDAPRMRGSSGYTRGVTGGIACVWGDFREV
jgi:ATP-binding cassette subfamily B protein